MAIITISRGSFSGAKLLAESVARQLNYRCIDRDVLVQRACAHNVTPDELLAAMETPPATSLGTQNHRKYIYLALMQAAFAEEVSAGNAVYHGLLGHRLLQERLVALRIRIIAPMEYRIRMAQEQMKISRTEAMAYIEKVDDHRGKWTRYLYGINWEDPSLYDLVINLQHISIEQASRLVGGMIKEGEFEFSAKHQAAMNDFILATRIRAMLARDPLTSNLEVEVESRAGKVTIKGEFYEQTGEIQRVTATMPSVLSVDFKEPESESPV